VTELIYALGRAAKDEARHSAEAKPTLHMTRAERIRDLVFMLRDQNGVRSIGSSWPSPWGDDRGDESPARLLAQWGHEAVPALLDAMEDRALTRTVGDPPYVLRVGDLAAAVLDRIAGRRFGADHALALGSTGGRARELSEARAWWAGLSTGVERQRLNSVVAKGGEGALEHARRLLAVYPEDVPGSVSIALRASSDAQIRRSLVELLCRELPGDAQRDVLLGLLRHADDVEIRILAAVWLHAHLEPSALPEALRIWGSPDGVSVSGPLIRFLVEVRTAGAVTALLSGLDQRPLGLSLEVLDAAGNLLRSERGPPVPAAVRAMWEDFLFASLDDTRPTGSRSILEGDFVAVERVADRAAMHLAAIIGGDPLEKASWCLAPAQRDAKLEEVRAAWKRRREAEAPSGPR